MMNHSIRIKISDKINKEQLLENIESIFNQNNFNVDLKDGTLIFERITAKRGASKFQIISELFEGFTKGILYIDPISQNELICRITHTKQLIISLIVGVIACAIFSLNTGSFFPLFYKVGVPITLIFLVIGVLSGNSKVEELLTKAVR